MTVVDRILHYKHEQMLDAAEFLEGSPVHLSELMKTSRLDEYEDGTQEWFYKGKLALIFFPPIPDNL